MGKKSKQNQKLGFTMVELLVVIALIGIISVMSTTTGKGASGKSKQGQAKAMLAGIYSMEKTFFAEYNYYSPYLFDIGFYAEGDLYYNVGFRTINAGANPSAPPVNADGFDEAMRPGIPTAAGAPYTQLIDFCLAPRCRFVQTVAGLPSAIDAACADCNVTRGAAPTFKASANGNITPLVVEDKWTMDQEKLLTNTQNGSM